MLTPLPSLPVTLSPKRLVARVGLAQPLPLCRSVPLPQAPAQVCDTPSQPCSPRWGLSLCPSVPLSPRCSRCAVCALLLPDPLGRCPPAEGEPPLPRHSQRAGGLQKQLTDVTIAPEF